MSTQSTPWIAHLLALLAGAGALGLFLLTILQFDFADDNPFPFALGLCLILGGGFAVIWPSLSWRWGIGVTSAFWLFLGFACFSFLANGVSEWLPAIQAVAILVTGCMGGLIGAWFRRTLGGA